MTPPPPAARSASVSGDEAVTLPPGYDGVPYELVEPAVLRMRKLIGKNMLGSVTTSAHALVEVAVDASALTDARAEANARGAAEGRSKLSFLPFIAAATAGSLMTFPRFNATFDGSRYLLWKTVHLGIAVDSEQGLVVPIVRDAQSRSVAELDDLIRGLATRARSRKLTMADLLGGTFTISSLGSHGVQRSTAIINQPQVAILSVPEIVPVVVPGSAGRFAVRPILNLALTYDHRAVDGADAARFASDVRDRLESYSSADYDRVDLD
jgi:pyruvate/2-oxoglutarate dehydrogenase complex dihydrolipoamide acyltransferase (E2) component